MPQENQVLRCYSCLAFQVHLVKKEKKWQCKICGSKQSVRKVYGKGSGKDCRLHVMKLNELQFSGHSANDCDVKDVNELDVQDCKPETETFTMNDIESESKWSQFIDKVDESSVEENDMNYEINENECFNNKKRKLNECVGYSSRKRSCDMTEKHIFKSNVETQFENNKDEEELKKYGMTSKEDCFVESGSKWSAFIDREQCSSDEECKVGTEDDFRNKTELRQNRPGTLPHKEPLNTNKLKIEKGRETYHLYDKYLVNPHFEENTIISGNEKERIGNLKILETLHDDDDLDEILNI